MKRRNFLKTLGAAATSGLAYGLIDKLTGSTKKEGLDSKIKEDIDSFKKVFREHNALPTQVKKEVVGGGGLDRHTYLHEYFKNHKGKYIPDGIRAHIANLIPGLAAEESKFDNGPVSPDGACGILQIMPSTFKDMHGDDEEKWRKVKNSLIEQTAFCFEYLDEKVYKYLNESEQAVPLKNVCAQFQLDKKESDVFSALVIINGYNAGQGNMVKIVKKFTEKYSSVRNLPENFNGTGLSLFYILINTALKREFSKSYGPHARNYVLKILAGSEVLNEKLGTSYGLEINDEGNEVKKQKSTAGGIISAGLTGIAAGAAARSLINKKNGPTNKASMGRRDFIKTTAKAGAILATAGIIGSKIPDIISEIDFKKEDTVEDMVDGMTFPDGSIYRQKHVGEQLRKFYKTPGNSIFPNENFGGDIEKTNRRTMDKLPVRNYTSSGFKNWFQENAKSGAITRYTSEKQITKAVKDGELRSVEEVNDLWRCHNAKGGHKYKGRNNPAYLALHPKGLDVLENIAKTFQQKLSDAGVDKSKWKIRPKVESLIRDEKMPNGSDLSPHEFGLGIDFSKKRAFDLIHVPDNTFMVISKEENELLYRSTETLFMEALQDVDKSNKVLITSESDPPHFHIAIKN